MAASPTELRTCPTRIDGASVLFAHKVTSSACQQRQREGYHKCFTCAYNRAYVAEHGPPAAVAAVPAAPAAEPVASRPSLERAVRTG